MTERADLTHVSFELPKVAVPELLSSLAEFAMEHGVSISFNPANAPAVTEAPSEEQKYNPERVTWVEDEQEPGGRVAVITQALLTRYSRATKQPSVTQLAGRLLDPHFAPSRELRTYLYCLEEPSSAYVYGNGGKWSIRADRARQLAINLTEGVLHVTGTGKTGAEGLEKYCQEMYLTPENT